AAARIRLLDHVEGVSDLYCAADALLLPSIVEGFSLVTLEALAFGLPLVLTDVGGARELLDDPVMGVLVPPWKEDLATVGAGELRRLHEHAPGPLVRALVEAMEAICLAPEAWRSTAPAREARLRAAYTTTQMARRYEQVFDTFGQSGCRRG
ncbi:MAG: glycosyltransferase, partial [Myxococcales bacterium]